LAIASEQLQRTGYGALPPGDPRAASAALIDLALLGGWTEVWDVKRKHPRPPATAGGLVECLRKVAHRQLAGWRFNRRPLTDGERATYERAMRRLAAKAEA